MRRLGPPSEIARLAAPVARLLDGAWQRMHWWVAFMALLYAFSGITVVRSDEVAVILRWGRLVGSTPALQEHGPGLMFAFPRPIDRVVRIPVRHIYEIPISTLDSRLYQDDERFSATLAMLDPIVDGYALTGDQNIVHVMMTARYRIRDAAEWAFYGASAESILRVEVTAAMVRSLGEMGVDQVLSDGRKTLIANATRRAQAGLDAAHAGLELSSLELTRLGPPAMLATDFDAVQSAFITAETNKKDAQAYAETTVPAAQASAEASLQSARGAAVSELAEATGAAAAFLALDREYRSNPQVVRERLYRDAVDASISNAGSVRWIPPPAGGNYQGLRVTVTSGAAAAPAPPTPGTSPSEYDEEP